jgi:sortase B
MNKKIMKIFIYILFTSSLLSFLTFTYFDSYINSNDNIIINKVAITNNEEIIESQLNEIEEIRSNYNNDDVIGKITISDTNINETIFQGDNNSYYLNHNGYKEYDQYGEVFLDYRINLNSSRKILIFGHNTSKGKTAFSELENYYDKSFYDNHKFITITLDNEIRNYEIFSVYVETSDWSYMNLNFNSNTDWYNHLLKLKNNSLYDTGIDIKEDDEVLILQTCSYNQNYKDYNKKYLLLISRRIG